ncbi:MAG: YebC/PmpR family DNA-binding transcriptional regulator [Dehalococcoidales bacterium]|nr:YebC/PmpR family DNA-binding transcriptional regulator [Dehalococcoidales bacterium]
MSGHNKWSSIKHQKGIADAKRGQVFTKITREIIVAVRAGGRDVEANYRLRLAIQKARDSNMPYDNIDRAIKRGSGEMEGAILTELSLEGYGPSGAAIMLHAVSDNRNRTLQDVRNIFTRHGGNLGESGSVAWLFDNRGIISIEAGNLNKEELELKAIDAGAEDIKIEDGYVEICTKPEDLETVRKGLESQNIPITSATMATVPKATVHLDEKAALTTLKLMEKLEELDDVDNVTSNVDFPDDIVEKYRSQP